MGNVAPILTHAPLREATASPWSGKCPPVDREWQSKVIEERKTQQRARGEPETGAGWSKVFDGAAITLTHRGITTPSNPLWLMAVGTKLIPDHSGFADPVMICFLDELLGDPAVVNPEGERHLEKLRRER
jgi:hypothetical protein